MVTKMPKNDSKIPHAMLPLHDQRERVLTHQVRGHSYTHDITSSCDCAVLEVDPLFYCTKVVGVLLTVLSIARCREDGGHGDDKGALSLLVCMH